MNARKKHTVERICKELDWEVCFDGDDVEFEKYSPAGEDFIFTVDADSLIGDVQMYYEDFDAEEHAAGWIEAKMHGESGIPSIRTLIEDADAIEEMLGELANALGELEE